MNQREAKREACHRAAEVIGTALDGGWPAEIYPDPADLEQVVTGLLELVKELERRGWRTGTAAGGEVR